MKFSYNWLKKYIDIKLTPEKLAELLTLYSFESGVLSSPRGGDAILDVDILPNRAHDSLSHYGLAKEIAALTKKSLKELKTEFLEDSKIKSSDFILVNVADKTLCPRYIAKVLPDVKVSPSPKWLQDELAKFNIKSHNNIVDILNYVMLEIGQPMHAFDYDKLEGGKIIVRKAKKGEKINTLDGGKYDLDENILVIADAKKPVAIAGIKGGLETGVSEKTKTIVIESANFEQSGIRKTNRTLGLNTDAAIRFSYGIDPNLAEFGLNRVCALIQEIISEVKITGDNVDIYPKKFLSRTIKLNLEYLNSLIGENIKPEFVKKTLELLGAKVKIAGKNLFLVAVPTIRLDLEIEEDLIEEVARLYGYMNLKSKMPMAAIAIPKGNDFNFLINKTRNILMGIGFSEVYNYSFFGNRDINGGDKKELIEIQNPISEDFRYLRSELVFNLLKNVKSNFRFFERVKFFEIGKIFSAKGGSASGGKTPEEKLNLAGIYAVKNGKEIMAGKRFFEMKGDLDILFENLGISDCWYDPIIPNKRWHPNRVAHIKHNKDSLGIIGEINPALLAVLDISGRVVMFNLDFEKLTKIAEEEREFSPISKYPAVIRDIAILVDRETRVSEVLNMIYGVGSKLVEDVDLFDYYEGEELPEGKKNLAFHIVYQGNRTLLDKEVYREEKKIKDALVKELNAEIR
ncbi:MAG: phenylalanine--tRNA ligase subunit beta [Candidatus Azambacteria bacterium]|nr:phenylalanine--tRNA ligase subunit beta [Candidatus Azambacteria bacterium]